MVSIRFILLFGISIFSLVGGCSCSDSGSKGKHENIQQKPYQPDRDSSGNTALHRAVQDNNAPLVSYYLDTGADPNDKNSAGNTPLHLCANLMFGKGGEIAQALIQRGANINSRDSSGRTPMHFAVKSSNHEVYRVLRDSGVTTDIKDPLSRLTIDQEAAMSLWRDGYLMQRIEFEDIEKEDFKLSEFLKGRTNQYYYDLLKNIIESRTSNTLFALEILKDNGIPITVKSDEGDSILFCRGVIFNPRVQKELISWLVANGIPINYKDHNGKTLFHYFSTRSIEMLDFMEGLGATIDIEDNNGLMPFHYAVMSVQVSDEILKWYLERISNIDIEDGNGFTPLHRAIDSSAYVPTMWLLKNGANSDKLDPHGVAFSDKWQNKLKSSLPSVGIDVSKGIDYVDEEGGSWLHLATRTDSIEAAFAIHALIMQGVNSNSENYSSPVKKSFTFVFPNCVFVVRLICCSALFLRRE